ncbi:MAG: regulatory signaling modulator protein AmpE [Gammaproteobacteria bacterium]
MNLIALFLGLILERTATKLFHLRELRWLDPYFDWGFGKLDRMGGPTGVVVVIVLILLPVLPILILQHEFSHLLFGLLAIAFATIVLFFSLGPRDLANEVEEYTSAVESGNSEEIARTAKVLTESDLPREKGASVLAVEEAVLIQANNRVFGVIFWFMILGPAGAWLFRVADLMRRRAVFKTGRIEAAGEPAPNYLHTLLATFGVLAWLPARLLALGYAMAGSFEAAVSDWRGYYESCSDKFFHVNDDILAAAGKGAIREENAEPEEIPVRPVQAATRLVNRTLLIWVTAISLLTLIGFSA